MGVLSVLRSSLIFSIKSAIMLEFVNVHFGSLLMKKRVLLFLTLALVFTGCAVNGKKSELVILYTNDVHTYIANTEKTDGGDVPALRFSKIAKMAGDLKAENKAVILVDAGDEIQGSTYSTVGNGEGIVRLMNEAGYDLATFGNHEFDFGVDHFYSLREKAKFPYISCNFKYLGKDGKRKAFEPYRIINRGGRKIAFIGISTPETMTSSTPAEFQDGDGNFIYTVAGLNNPQDLYDQVQEQIDRVRSKVDYCIAIAHVGVSMDEIKKGVSSTDIIKNTSGLDAFIGGHSHSEIEGEVITDKSGRPVLSTQTGSYLSAAGVMTISLDGRISTSLVREYDSSSVGVEKIEEELISTVTESLGKQVAVLDSRLYVSSPDDEKIRLVRAQETNMGDFCADTIYWFFNMEKKMNCDIALYNGGGIRTLIKEGPVTLNDVKNVMPFGNMICLINATGRQILDSLEMGVTVTGEWDSEWNCPAENGGFLQVAGLRYTVDPSHASTVKIDGNGMFQSVEGKYRVRNVEVYNKDAGTYEKLDPEKVYAVGGINYILRNSGNGLSMFRNCPVVVDYAAQDFEVMSDYFRSFKAEGDYPVVNTQNSPLASYDNYQLDYENPHGAGRIKILGK